MNGEISAIVRQKRNRLRCSIFIDKEYAFSLSDKLAASLQVGMSLTPEETQQLQLEDEKQVAFDRALHYLQYRPRSCSEILQYLEKKGFSRAATREAMARLEGYGYVDDAAFARMWIESRSRTRPRGEFGLRYELRQKGVAESVIDQMLTGYEESGPAWRAVAPRLSAWAKLDRAAFRQKIYQHLNRRGFCRETAREVYEKALASANKNDQD